MGVSLFPCEGPRTFPVSLGVRLGCANTGTLHTTNWPKTLHIYIQLTNMKVFAEYSRVEMLVGLDLKHKASLCHPRVLLRGPG